MTSTLSYQKKSKTVLILAAHPDDEVLGMGGTIARHTAAEDLVHVVFMTDGEGARGSSKGAEGRRTAALSALDILGVAAQNIHFHDFPDNRMDSVPLLDIAQAVERHVAAINPAVVYTHHAGDLNIDHRLTHQAVLTALRPQPGSGIEKILAFEVSSSTEWAGPRMESAFIPHLHVDITPYWQAKLKALKAYAEEMRPFPHARSYEALEALATLRGVQAGTPKAEAFTLIREIIR